MNGIKFITKISTGHQWPNGRPVTSERLPDNRFRHTLEDGRALIVGEPTYRIDYLSNWVGVPEGSTYEINLSLLGLSPEEGFYEAWNFDIGELRSYKFSKTVRATHIRTGEVFDTTEFEEGTRLAVECKNNGE